MEVLMRIAKNAQRLNVVQAAREAFSNPEIKSLIIDLNTNKQLFIQGIDSKGVLLPLYSPNSKKKPGSPYDLKDTGAFYKSFRVIVTANGDFIIDANTMKGEDDLRIKASPFIVGLTDESKEIITQRIIPIIQDYTYQTIMEGV
jgi:hypothetical protein